MENAMQASQRVMRVYTVMKLTYGLVPIVAGLDKFTNLLTNWEQYLNPALAQMLPFSAATFMMIVGVIEIVAGVLVLTRPLIGGYIVMAWLIVIALSLLAGGMFLDVAVRDLVMAAGAYSFVQIAHLVTESHTGHASRGQVAFT